jgi:hypothetical protein
MKTLSKKFKLLIVVVVVSVVIAGFGLSRLMIKEEDNSSKIVIACLNLEGAKLVLMDFGYTEIENVNINSSLFLKEWFLEEGRGYNIEVKDEAGKFQGIENYGTLSVALGHAYMLEWNSTCSELRVDFVYNIDNLQGYLDDWQD